MDWGLVAPIREVLDSLSRAPGQRRVTYHLIDNFQDDSTVARLIERGNRKNDDPKSELGEFVHGTLATMRDIGLAHPNEVADGRSTLIQPHTVDDSAEYLEQLLRAAKSGYRHDRLAGQPRRVEIWSEATDTLPDLTGLGDEYGVPVSSSSGSIGFDPVSRLGHRMAFDAFFMSEERPVDVLYLGDFDPAGLSISDTIEHAEIQASRWYRSWMLRYPLDPDEDLPENGVMPQNQAWAEACAEFPNGGEPLDWAEVNVIRLGVVQDDLDGRSTSPVKMSQIEKQYKRWWPEGETRTLQLEGLAVDEVVDRVRAALVERIDRDVLGDVLETEAENRAEVLERLE